jgi:hypothetical protein
MATRRLERFLVPSSSRSSPGEAGDLAADQDLAPIQVDVGPAQPAYLSPPGAEHHGQDQEQPQLRVLGHGGVDEPFGLGDLGWSHIWPLDRWAGDQRHRVVVDPAPHLRLLERPGQDGMDVADSAGGHGQPADAVGRMLALAQPGSGPVAVPGPQRRLPDADEVLAVLAAGASLAELGEEPVDGGGVDAAEPQLTDGRDDLVLDQAAVAEHGALGDLALAGSPFAPGVQQLGHGLVAGGPVLAGPCLPDEPGFELAGPGAGPGRAGLLALLAGERVAAGVDDDPPAVAALLDHPCEASCSPVSGTRMII